VGRADGFITFWEAYPKKKKHVEARQVWDELNPSDELAAEIVAAVERQKHWDEWNRERGRYIPEPAKWLKLRQWTDREPENKGDDNGQRPSRGDYDPARHDRFYRANRHGA
jgi:hypothetical protein